MHSTILRTIWRRYSDFLALPHRESALLLACCWGFLAFFSSAIITPSKTKTEAKPRRYPTKKDKIFLNSEDLIASWGVSDENTTNLFQKGSFTIPTDSSGILLVKIFQVRRTSDRKHSTITTFGRVVLRAAKYRLNKKRKRKFRAIVVRSQQYFSKP